MERVRRRWWTWTVSVAAVLVILAGSVSGLFQLAVMALPEYRDDLSAWVTRVAGRPVQIGGINLVWRGINPRLDLSDITIYDAETGDEALTADRLSLGFGLMRLLKRDYSPQRVVLSGLDLDVTVDAEGRIGIDGFARRNDDHPLDLRKWLREVGRFNSVRIENCTIDLDDQRAGKQAQLRFVLSSLDLDVGSSGFEADALVNLPANYGNTLRVEASVDGPLPEPQMWSGEFTARADGLLPQPWLRGRVAPGTRVAAEDVEGKLAGKFEDGRVTGFDLRLDSELLLATRAGRTVETPSLSMRAQASRDGEAWRVDLSRFELDDDEQLHGQLRWQPLAGGGYDLGIESGLLKFDRLLPWLEYARELPPALQRAPHASGEIDDLVLRLHHTAEGNEYSLRAQLKDLALKSEGEAPGFSGVSGELSASDAGGRFAIERGTPTLTLPRIFDAPLALDELKLPLQWRHLPEGWQLSAKQFDWKLAGTTGRGRFALLLPAEEGASPELDLSANLAAADINRVKPYMPRHWSDGLKNWLGKGIETGRVARGKLEINGPLRQFPFTDGGGVWNLDLDVAGARLMYSPRWPKAENLSAKLHFHGNGLSIDADSADIGGSHAGGIQARIRDFRDHLLVIDGSVEGEMAKFYDFVRNSPLQKNLAGLLNHTRASGPARVALHLDIPLNDADKTAASGTIGLGGVQMFYADMREPVSDIRGDIAFNNGGVTAQQLSAGFQGLNLAARIEPRAQTHGVVVADFPYAPDAQGGGVSSYIPELIRNALAGESRWHAELPLGVENTELALSSDLRGTSLGMPAPLGKAADAAAPIRITIGGGVPDGTRVRVGYDNRLAADLAMRQPVVADAGKQTVAAAPAAMVMRSASLQLGGGTPQPVQEGIALAGDAAEIDLMAWSAALGSAVRGEAGGLRLRNVNVHADRWLLAGRYLRDTRMIYAPLEDGWTLRLGGGGAEGELYWTPGEGGKVSANLARLEMDKLPPPPETAEKPAPARPLNPADWPLFEVSCGKCILDGADFGRIKLNTLRAVGGQKLEYLTAEGGKVELSASGEWLRAREQSSGKLKFDVSSADFTSVLRSLGYAQNLSAKNSRLSGDLDWPAAASGLAWAQAHGHIAVVFDNGTLKAVDPGAGRVLGLFNFYALPRRLTLDFRDVVKSGLAFDKINGSFDLADGVATTNDLEIKSPSLRMEMRGRVGLVAKDYDQRVSVYPDMTSGITLGAALVGGPALAALAFLAQEILDKPIEQATHLSYRVTGSWDNPEVKRDDSRSEAAAPAAPAPTPAPVPAAQVAPATPAVRR